MPKKITQQKIIQPDPEKSCDSCGAENVLLHHVEKPLFTSQPEEGYEFCDFCYMTFAGNAAQYPNQYEHGEVMRHICAVANILLRKLKTPEVQS
jgi:hypothetical protein